MMRKVCVQYSDICGFVRVHGRHSGTARSCCVHGQPAMDQRTLQPGIYISSACPDVLQTIDDVHPKPAVGQAYCVYMNARHIKRRMHICSHACHDNTTVSNTIICRIYGLPTHHYKNMLSASCA